MEEGATQVKDIVDSKSEKLKKVGGARPGAGMPKGYVTKKKLEKLAVKRELDQRVLRAVPKLFAAQMDLACGEKVLMVKRTTGDGKDRKVTTEIVTDVETIAEYIIDDGITLNQETNNEYYYITTKQANNQAIEGLLNRVLGKAPDKIEITGGLFAAQNMTVNVVGSKHEVIDVGDDGQLISD